MCQSGEHDDSGFSMVEVLAAIAILAVVLLGTLQAAIVSMTASAAARGRSVATGLVNGDLSQVDGLSFTSLKAGLNPSVDNLLADPNITASTSGGVTTYVFVPTGATILASNTNTDQSPLVPHIRHVDVGGLTYSVATYPTTSTSAHGLVTVTVIVTWKSPTGGTLSATGEAEVATP